MATNAEVAFNCIYNCCQIFDALMDTTETLVNICDTTVMVLAMPPAKGIYGYFSVLK